MSFTCFTTTKGGRGVTPEDEHRRGIGRGGGRELTEEENGHIEANGGGRTRIDI